MVSLSLQCAEAEAELLSAELWEYGASGIQEESLPGGRCRLTAWFEEPGRLLEQFSAWHPALAEERNRDWEAESRQAWQPFAVGNRLWLAPEWDECPAPNGRLRLTVHPGLALGTGAHPATRLCLAALERHLLPGDQVLDVGTGSGILAGASWLLGASNVVGCDMDGEALDIGRRNLTCDGHSARLFRGSARSLAHAAVDLLVANINAAAHAALAAEYSRVARRAVIVSGYASREAREVERSLTRHGLHAVDTLDAEDWMCLVLCKEEPSSPP
jgi:ribosomal protein L11 methyltransferase